MKSLSEAKVRECLPKNIIKFHFVGFMCEDDATTTWFLFWQYLHNVIFSDKKNSNAKHFAHVGFCTPDILTKFWDFAAGMDFDT